MFVTKKAIRAGNADHVPPPPGQNGIVVLLLVVLSLRCQRRFDVIAVVRNCNASKRGKEKVMRADIWGPGRLAVTPRHTVKLLSPPEELGLHPHGNTVA